MSDQIEDDLDRLYSFAFRAMIVIALVIAFAVHVRRSTDKLAIEAGLVQDEHGHWVKP